MKRAFKLLVVALTVMLMLTSCTQAKKTETDLAKESITAFYKAVKEIKPEEMAKYVAEEKVAELQMTTGVPEAEIEMMKALLGKTDIKFKSGKIEDKATEGKLVYEADAVDFTTLLPLMLEIALAQGEELDYSKIDFSKVGTIKKDITIEVVKEKEKWVVANPEVILLDLLAAGDFAE